MPYNLRDGSNLVLPKTKSSRYGINSLRFRGSFLWNTEADLGLLQHPRWSSFG